MANFPNITQPELYVLAAAAMLLFIAPALLSWKDERRRRLAQRATLAAQAQQFASSETLVPLPTSTAVPGVEEEAPPTFDAAPLLESPAPAPSDEPASAVPVGVAPVLPVETLAPRMDVDAPLEIQPLSGEVRYRFRLDDLHRAQLPDWPPAAIRDDPERLRIRQETERATDAFSVRLHSATIASLYPARSYCLGSADADASELRLAFLLFPVLWPVSQNQAVAQAVFRIDRLTGVLQGWVDALRPQELSDENRREIREAGGIV